MLALAGLLVPRAAAQAPEPSPSPQAAPSPPAAVAPGTAPVPAAPVPGSSTVPAPASAPATAVAEAAGAAAPTCTLEEPCVRAETQGFEKGRFWFSGFVDLRAGDIRIQADRVEVEDQPGPKGTSRILRAEGNVVFLKEDERLAGEKLELNLASGKGALDNASGFMDPGVFVEGRRIERLDADSYRILGGNFTSCSQPNPRWSFSASSARVDLDKRITASNVVFRVKRVPALYFPYFVYPINSQGRATGLLFPHFGYSSIKGFETGTGFFWAMNRSFDQTFYADRYSKLGYGFGHEFRYQLGGVSNGSFRTYAIKPKSGGELDYDLNWNGVMALPSKVRASVAVRQFSNLLFQTQFQDDLNLATTRTRRVTANLQRSFKGTQLRAYLDNTETFFGEFTQVNRRAPGVSLSRTSQRLGRTGIVYGYEARAERLAVGDQDLVNSYSRFDVAPQVSRPFSVPYLSLTPRVAYRFTRYSATVDGPLIDGPALNRPFFETSLELIGPQFSRVFTTEGGFYSDKFKHVISPEVTWTYRTRVEDFDVIPLFDGIDRYLGTNQFAYGLVQDFYAKRAVGAGGKLAPYRFLTWSVRQTYYVNINENQGEFDPNYSSAIFGPGGTPHHTSPIQSRLRFRPTPQTSLDYGLEYDTNFKQVRSMNLNGTLGGGWGSFSGGWARRAFARGQTAETLTVTSNTLRGQASLRVVPEHLTLSGGVDYDAVRKSLLTSRVMARYDVQCCGFQVELLQYKLGTRQEKLFRFAIELANIGSMGNFLGQDQGVNRSYR